MAREPEFDIIHKIKIGDEVAFSKLFEVYYTRLCFFSNKYIADIDLSRSIVQQVFVDLWIKREKLNIKQSVKLYLFSSVKNASIDFLRKNKTHSGSLELDEDNFHIPFHDILEEAELNHKINKGINDLPEKCREIFLLCRSEGLKYADIAKKLNISVKTVEMQISIALKRLRESLSDYQMINLLMLLFSKK